MLLLSMALIAVYLLATAPSRPPKPAPPIQRREGFTVIYPRHRSRP